MKLKLGVTGAADVVRDIILSCNVTTTVNEAAAALARSELLANTHHSTTPLGSAGALTLCGDALDGTGWRLLDPATRLGACGLQSGWQVSVAAEFSVQVPRIMPLRGTVEVLTGTQTGARFSLIDGINTLGRDQTSRIMLEDLSVSRRHAVIEIEQQIIVRDLGSANGIGVLGQQVTVCAITQATEVTVGVIRLRVCPSAQLAIEPTEIPDQIVHTHQHLHTRAPRVEPRFAATVRQLPQPPSRPQSHRMPMLAMLAPMMLGGAMYLITKSPMSLMMMAFSPMMMLGSWIDNRVTIARTRNREQRDFMSSLAIEHTELSALMATEIATRTAESPALATIATAIRTRNALLWVRRPEHQGFLELRFGDGTLPSRTRVQLPQRGNTDAAHWAALRQLQRDFAACTPVPVLERIDRPGSIGVIGAAEPAAGLMRSLVLQLVGLHSPSEVTLAAFAASERACADWEWLKWLPHTDPIGSPIAGWQLSSTPDTAVGLLASLELLVEQRRGKQPGTVRSDLAGEQVATRAETTVASLPLTPTVIVLVFDEHLTAACRNRLLALAEDGPDASVHLLWLASKSTQLPAACRSYVEVEQRVTADEPMAGLAHFVRYGQTVPLHRVEYVTAQEASTLARSLSPVEDTATRALDQSDLPQLVRLASLHPVDVLGGAEALQRNWRDTGTLVRLWNKTERAATPLSAVVGQGAAGVLHLDLRVHGPHALVGGTTGSGKSEFLQTWIMSLAASISPDRLTFLLVDYKGGAAFAECVHLPHTVGLVTDLNSHLVRRVLRSLRAELRYREALLARRGAKDLITMERRADPTAPPSLVIVIDEFAALATEIPEFVDGMIDIAQRGRSLGLHLIMATQRPAGVIKESLRANTNLRIALRMADESESSDVIGVTDAAFFDSAVPGRGAAKVGPGKITQFQTAYLGARAQAEAVFASIGVHDLGFNESEPWNISEPIRDGHAPVQQQTPRDIERLCDNLVAAAAQESLTPPRRPWLDALPSCITLEQVRTRHTAQDGAQQSIIAQQVPHGVLIGLRDLPDMQAQEPVDIQLDEIGNLAIFGASGTGKTSALLCFAAELSIRAATDPVHLYAIDAAGGGLTALQVLPTVGAVADGHDDELVRRVLDQIRTMVQERGKRFAASRAAGLPAYRKLTRRNEARVVLLLDGFSAFRQATEAMLGTDAPLPMLAEIMQAGRSVGVHVLLTADRVGVVPSFLAANVQQQLVLRLASAPDYAYVDVPAAILAEAVPGRAVFAGHDEEIQLALLTETPDLDSQTQALSQIAERLNQQELVPVTSIRHTPTRIALHELPIEHSGLPVFGIETRTETPATMPTTGLIVVAGPAASGVSTAALCCAEAITRWCVHQGITATRVLLSLLPESAAEGLATRSSWDRLAQGSAAVARLAAELTHALTSDPPTFPQAGTHGVIVVERSGDVDSTSTLSPLVALAKVARRSQTLVVFECEPQSTARSWELFAALQAPRWGIALQPEAGEPGSPFREDFGRAKRADFPPGRGYSIESGHTIPIHVALPQSTQPADAWS